MSQHHRLLFCLENNRISGGNRILFEIANRCSSLGFEADIVFLDSSGAPSWLPLNCTVCDASWEDSARSSKYDLVLVTNAASVARVLPLTGPDRLVLFCQGFESYCYGETLVEVFTLKRAFTDILNLPIPIVATSESIRSLLRQNHGLTSYLVPVAIDTDSFPASPSTAPATPKRILAVGDYTIKSKGIFDLCDALELLSKELPVELVLITQRQGRESRFKNYSFRIEKHYCPKQQDLPSIYASCHLYCCASWYEGFGLPCLEAFSVGVPVVCVDNYGVVDFVMPNENLLLAQPNNAKDLVRRLRRVLFQDGLASKLIKNGRLMLQRYTWERTMSAFATAMEEIISATKRGKVELPDPEAILSMLARLEADGLYTPPAVQRELVDTSSELEQLIQEIKGENCDRAAIQLAVSQLRDRIKQHLHNPRASYYAEFKARYDLCQIMISFDGQPELAQLLRQG